MIVVVDYHTGNLGSIVNMLKKLGHRATLTSDPTLVAQASRLILPGVGSFDYGMQKLEELNLITALESAVIRNGVPVLGICLGAQLMCKSSDEGVLPGLGWIDAVVKKFPIELNNQKFKVPHIGWDYVLPIKKSNLFHNVGEDPRFYFVHSYHIICAKQSDVLTENKYATSYHSAFETGNIIGVQFHPEKSHKFGMQLFRNFIGQN